MSEHVQVVQDLRRRIVVATQSTGEGHIPSAFSVLDVLWVLYDRILRYDSEIPAAAERDIFILSKGHAALGLYAVLAAKGFFDASELRAFGTKGSRLGGHPDCRKVPGVEASTGSLGHGLPIGVGIALGQCIKRSSRRVFVLVGDGECNEGTVWESALLAAHHKLGNLTCIVDYNHSTDPALPVGDLVSKFAAFGWSARTIDGHDPNAIYRALTEPHRDQPQAVVCRTVKGHGCQRMENNPAWHHRGPSQEEIDEILEELR